MSERMGLGESLWIGAGWGLGIAYLFFLVVMAILEPGIVLPPVLLGVSLSLYALARREYRQLEEEMRELEALEREIKERLAAMRGFPADGR